MGRLSSNFQTLPEVKGNSSEKLPRCHSTTALASVPRLPSLSGSLRAAPQRTGTESTAEPATGPALLPPAPLPQRIFRTKVTPSAPCVFTAPGPLNSATRHFVNHPSALVSFQFLP